MSSCVPMTLMLSIVEHVLFETDFNTLAFIDRPLQLCCWDMYGGRV